VLLCGDAATGLVHGTPDKLWRGILPTDDSVKTWGGYGTGLTCDGCDAPITSSEPEHEEEMSDGRILRFHVACDGLWRVLKGTLPPTT
jgi:hypothetical protein